MTKKKTKSRIPFVDRLATRFGKYLAKKKVSRKTRSSLASIAGIASITLTILVFAKAHRETTTLLDQTKIRTQAIQALLDDQNFGYAIMDQEGKIVEWNPAMERLTHYTEKEVKANGLGAMMPPNIFLKHQEAISKVMADKELSGKVAVVNCTVLPHGAEDQPLPVRMTIRVVQDRRGKRYAIAHMDDLSLVKDYTVKP